MEKGMVYDHQTREGTHKKARKDIQHHHSHIHLVLSPTDYPTTTIPLHSSPPLINMPQQMRGYWNCEYCGRMFDEFSLAGYHEAYECPRLIANTNQQQHHPSSSSSAMASSSVAPPAAVIVTTVAPTQQYQHHQQQQQQHAQYQYGAPSASEYPHYPHHQEQQQQQQQQQQYPSPPAPAPEQQQQQQMAPTSIDPYISANSMSRMIQPSTSATTTTTREHVAVVYRAEPSSPPLPPPPQPLSPSPPQTSAAGRRQRRYLFWSPETVQSPPRSSFMDEADIVACRSVEVFEVDNDSFQLSSSSTTAFIDSRGVRIMPALGQVGLRCIHCIVDNGTDHGIAAAAAAAASTTGISTVFPVNLREVASAIRLISETHLLSCSRAGSKVCESLEQALARRRASQAEAIGNGPAANDNGSSIISPSVANARFQQEEYRRHLLEYCNERTRELDLLDCEPPPGIVFGTRSHAAAAPAAANVAGTSISEAPRYYASTPGDHLALHQQQLVHSLSSDHPSVPPLSRGTERALVMNMPPTPPSFERSFRGSPTVPVRSPHHAGEEVHIAHAEQVSLRDMQQQQQQHRQSPSRRRQSPQQEHRQQQQRGTSHDSSTHDVMPANYPFQREPSGDWICKFCQHIPAQYRDYQYRWAVSNHTPPPASFIDHHLNQCRMYQQSLLQDVHQDIPPHVGFPFHAPLPTSRHHHQRHQQQQQQQYSQQEQSPYHLSRTQQTVRVMPGWESSVTTSVGPSGAASAHVGDAGGGGGYYTQLGVQLPSTMRGSYRGGGGGSSSSSGRLQPSVMEREGAVLALTPKDQAIAHLKATDMSCCHSDGTPLPEASMLVLEEDRLLLTDYFYYLMRQLRLVRFSESDRKTRGGKREKIQVGYGGLQCVHCATQVNARKFFWSNVDRLANSFAEIPAHVLKCRSCPERTKNALLTLKEQHPDQMTRLPRGSQKVFFRRMWRRLHDQDPAAAFAPLSPESQPSVSVYSAAVRQTFSEQKNVAVSPREGDHHLAPTTTAPAPSASLITPGLLSGSSTSGSEETVLLLERTTIEAAKALAEAAIHSGPPSPTSRVLLAIPEDSQWLSDHDCFVRRQIEVFCATKEDIETARTDRKYPVQDGQVGIRCIHCAIAKAGGATGQAVSYPFSVGGIYESVREFHRLHLDECEHLPPSVKTKLQMMRGCSSLSSVLRKYYVLSARCLGLVDTKDGIRAGGETAPLDSQAAFSFDDSSPGARPISGHEASLPPLPPSLEHPPPPPSRKRSLPDDTSPRDDDDGEVQDRKPMAR